MGPYVALIAVFIGFFAFAAIYHVVLWSQSRRDLVLLVFAIHCVICAVFSGIVVAIVTSHTAGEGQRALDLRTDVGLLSVLSSFWLLSLIADVRARWFFWFLAAFCSGAVIVNVAILPLVGTVTHIELVTTWWGEEVSLLHRGPPVQWIGLAYAVVISVPVFGFVCAARLWTRDRIGSALLVVASTGMLVSDLWDTRIDMAGARGQYVGIVPYAMWVLLLSIEIARDYGLRAAERNHAHLALAQSREELKQLTAGLLTAREEERTAIAREIHDVLGQSLTALKMDVAWIGARAPDAAPPFAQKLAAMPGLIDDMVVTVRRIASNLRPGVLDDFGLAAAIEWQAQEFEQRTGVSCVLRTAIDDGALDPLLATALFRIFQESLTNVTRHSRASRVSVTLEHLGTDLVLEVRDDGVGITPVNAASTQSIGLTGMRERAQLVGGRLSVTGAAGAGTTVRAQVPHRVAIIQSAAGVVPGPAGAA